MSILACFLMSSALSFSVTMVDMHLAADHTAWRVAVDPQEEPAAAHQGTTEDGDLGRAAARVAKQAKSKIHEELAAAGSLQRDTENQKADDQA